MRSWRWRGLRTKIITWSFVPTAIILTTVALVGFYAYQQVTQDLTIQSSREVARLSAGQLAAELSEFSNPLTALARTSSIYENNVADQRAALTQASNRLFIFDGGVLILDNLGTVIATQLARPEILGMDWKTANLGAGIFLRAEWWRTVLVGSAVFSSVIILLLWDGGMQLIVQKGLIGLLINVVILIVLLLLKWPPDAF